MSCHSCKNKANGTITVTNERKTNIFLKLFYFLIGVIIVIVLLPIVGLIGIYMLFNTMVLDKSTELMPSLSYLGNLLTKNKKVEDEDEYIDVDSEDFDIDDYELLNVDEIKK